MATWELPALIFHFAVICPGMENVAVFSLGFSQIQRKATWAPLGVCLQEGQRTTAVLLKVALWPYNYSLSKSPCPEPKHLLWPQPCHARTPESYIHRHSSSGSRTLSCDFCGVPEGTPVPRCPHQAPFPHTPARKTDFKCLLSGGLGGSAV